jgi:hypothetical protein
MQLGNGRGVKIPQRKSQFVMNWAELLPNITHRALTRGYAVLSLRLLYDIRTHDEYFNVHLEYSLRSNDKVWACWPVHIMFNYFCLSVHGMNT